MTGASRVCGQDRTNAFSAPIGRVSSPINLILATRPNDVQCCRDHPTVEATTAGKSITLRPIIATTAPPGRKSIHRTNQFDNQEVATEKMTSRHTSEPGRSAALARADPSWRNRFAEVGLDIQPEVDRPVPELTRKVPGVRLILVDLATDCGTDPSCARLGCGLGRGECR
jgi:hypothetical protein